MAECGECGADLQPAWKFCVFCGTPVAPPVEQVEVGPATPNTEPAILHPFTSPTLAEQRVPEQQSPPQPAPLPSRLAIPSAIRPPFDEQDADVDPLASARPKFDLPLVLGIAIGVFGVVAMTAGFVILIGGN